MMDHIDPNKSEDHNKPVGHNKSEDHDDETQVSQWWIL